jgi:hypothetical protein
MIHYITDVRTALWPFEAAGGNSVVGQFGGYL